MPVLHNMIGFQFWLNLLALIDGVMVFESDDDMNDARDRLLDFY